MGVSVNVSAAVGTVCEAFLYGVYCVLFVTSIVILTKRYRAPSRVIWVAHCLLFLTSTAHFALVFNYLLAKEHAPFSEFGNETLLLYRCWYVWGNNFYMIILPLLTALGGFGCILPIPSLVLSINPTSPVPPTEIVPLTIAGYALPLCTNIMVTGLIAGRLWHMSRIPIIDEHGKPALLTIAAGGRAMMLIIESGALYTVTQLIFVILVAIGNHPGS